MKARILHAMLYASGEPPMIGDRISDTKGGVGTVTRITFNVRSSIQRGSSILFRQADVEEYINELEIIRTGSGRRATTGKMKASKLPPNWTNNPIMTDEEAQNFFDGLDLTDVKVKLEKVKED